MLGTSLRNLVKDWRAKGITLGGKSYGSLKETTIKKLTQYYQKAILENKGDIQDYLTKIVPIYQRLASDSLLKVCARCLTQNSNESLHSAIWSKCSKGTSAKSRCVNIAASKAVSEHNFGILKALKGIQKTANLDLGEEASTLDYRRKKERNRPS
ncbi:uncharacterized protein TNCV_2030841 [Trichonephila clavipes]|nr:uncharacterized protein TNCV_2030841 [Trichonephila clavipes]